MYFLKLINLKAEDQIDRLIEAEVQLTLQNYTLVTLEAQAVKNVNTICKESYRILRHESERFLSQAFMQTALKDLKFACDE